MEQSDRSARPRRGIRITILLLTMLAFLIASLAAVWCLANQRARRERTRWKGPALEQLAVLSITNEVIREELDQLKAGPKPDIDFGWANDHVLLMTNGEYIIFACRHGYNNGSVDHLFLGRGSNGRWLYSTFHFCSSMVMVRGDNPPGSITEFEERYFAREFDGKSDECLKHTWPVRKQGSAQKKNRPSLE